MNSCKITHSTDFLQLILFIYLNFHNTMESVLKRLLFVLLVSGCCLSCKKEQNEAVPVTHFKNLENNALVWNTVNLELVVPNAESVQQVEILINSKSFAVLLHAPFQVDWNTLAAPDGDYLLKAIVNDHSGNQNITETNVHVQNALLTFTVPTDHLSVNEKAWIFLTNRDGQVITIAELKNGADFKLIDNTYTHKSFMLSEAYLQSGAHLSITSFEDVPRGQWTVASKLKDTPVLGRLAVDFKDEANVPPYYISASGDSRTLIDGGNSVELNITQFPTRLFIREIFTDNNHYKLIDGLSNNDRYSGHFSELSIPLNSIESEPLPGAQMAAVRLYGFPDAHQLNDYYALGAFILSGNKVKIEYPGNTFAAYGSESHYRGNNIRITAFHPTKMFDLTPIHAEVLFRDTGNASVYLASSGMFDAYVVEWGFADKISSFSWILLGSAGQSDLLKLSNLPDAIHSAGITNFNVRDLEFNNVVQVADYEIANDYKSYTQYISRNGYNSPYLFGKAWKEQTFSQNGATGGRQKIESDPPTIKDRLQR